MRLIFSPSHVQHMQTECTQSEESMVISIGNSSTSHHSLKEKKLRAFRCLQVMLVQLVRVRMSKQTAPPILVARSCPSQGCCWAESRKICEPSTSRHGKNSCSTLKTQGIEVLARHNRILWCHLDSDPPHCATRCFCPAGSVCSKHWGSNHSTYPLSSYAWLGHDPIGFPSFDKYCTPPL